MSEKNIKVFYEYPFLPILNKVILVFAYFTALTIPLCSYAGVISKNNNFTPGTVISSSQINSNFDQLFIELNAKETRIGTLESATWTKNGALLYYNGGNVGIGTATPTTTLDVRTGNIVVGYDGATANKFLKNYAVDHAAANVPSQLDFTIQDGFVDASGTGAGMSVRNVRDGAFNSQSIAFVTHHGNVTGGVRMVIDKGGSVGIGDTTPDTTLKVVGSICAKSDGINCAGNVAGTIYANNTTVQGADYAEYFLSEEKLEKGEIVGLNTASGLARRYKSGDKLLGIVSTNPGVTGNSEIKDRNSVLVALVGQVPFNKIRTNVRGSIVTTLDGVEIGYLLSNGNVYINISTNNYAKEIAKIKSENLMIKAYLCSKEPTASICEDVVKNTFSH